ncbi:hypothetical protein [Micromonospora sp. NPDC093277]|uniref:hypothetical protein n=1 Tax=Micromonospora sp. NPDC093277 TaxID=3364291 RepID=UPI003825421B
MRVHAYAAPSPSEPLAPVTIERRDVGPDDVLIEIRDAGICHCRRSSPGTQGRSMS